MSSIDLSTLDAETAVTFDVPVAFDDKGAPISGFTVVGKNSDQYRAAKRKQDVIAIKKSMQRGKSPDAKTDAGAEAFIDDATARETAVSIACVVGWYGFTRAGVAIELTADELAGVFTKRPTWLEKVSAAIATDANFTQG